MKLATSIPTRRDGTVRVTAPSGRVWVFAHEADGDVVCEVGDAADVAWLVALPHFTAADPSPGRRTRKATAE